MPPSTSRQRKASRPPSTSTRSPSVLTAPLPKRRRADPAAPTYIIAGAVVAILGLGFAVGLAISPGAGERHLVLKLLPWVVALGGIVLAVVGFIRLGPSSPRAT